MQCVGLGKFAKMCGKSRDAARRLLLALNSTHGKPFIFKDESVKYARFRVDIGLLMSSFPEFMAPDAGVRLLSERLDSVEDRLLRIESYFGGAGLDNDS